ncbi:MAG: helix-turn-helix transcriptional regulator [Thomasclavelia ramosa]|nr:helix-turn-helix transcriptional regulator [Thomasclavelia ramosa]
MEIGERLKQLRIKRKLTQFEVEELTGINRSTLSLYELGIRVPPIDKLMQLALLYKVSIDYLCGIEESYSEDFEKVKQGEKAQ